MNNMRPFRFWCQKVLPLVYDDSLSYYELLCKVVDYLNKVIDVANQTNEGLASLQKFVSEYFESANFQEFVNKKLDEMAEDGTLAELIASLGNVVKFYENGDEAVANVGDIIFIDGVKRNVEDSNNGYGVAISNGLYANFNPTAVKKLGSTPLSKFGDVAKLTGGTTYVVLQGGCYDESNNRYAFWFDNNTDDVNGCLVIADGSLNVISRTTHNIKHINDLTWCSDLNQYVGVTGSQIFLFDTSGNLSRVIDQTNPAVGTISWDSDYKVFVGFGGALVNEFYVKIMDVNFNVIKRVSIPTKYNTTLFPNQNPYTAWQGSCIINNQFYLLSSVFYNDVYRKCQWMINHIDTTSGDIVDTTKGFYYLSGCEAECLTYDGTNVIAWGYSNQSRGGYICGDMIAFDSPDIEYLRNRGGYDIYYADGSVNGDGMSPSTPCNNIQGAFAMACRVPHCTLHLLTDVSGGAFVSGGSINVDGNGHTISELFDIENDAHVVFNNVVFKNTLGNRIIYCINSRVDFMSCVFNGDETAEYEVRIVRGRCFVYDCTCNDASAMLSVASGSVCGIESVIGDNTGLLVYSNSGSITCVNGREGLVTGFDNIGREYGGKVFFGKSTFVNE